MEAKSIKDYAKIMKEMELTALEISEANGVKVRLERNITQVVSATPATQVINVEPKAASIPVVSEIAAADSTAAKKDIVSGLIPITSPMVGVFYISPSENAAPYVSVGDKIKKGDVLCIIEAMKLMNEITAEEDGIIEEICVNNGQVVDFGHIMFRISKA